MDLNKIVQMRLFKEEHRKLPKKSHYKLVYVDKNNYLSYEKELKQVIVYINEQLPDWEDSPHYLNIESRFWANSFCFLFYYNDKCIGWNWGNNNVCIDWINIYKTLEKGEVYLGGCFVTNVVDRPADAGVLNYNMFFDECIKLGNDVLYGYCDDWNRVALRINYSNGYKEYDFLS